MAKVLLTFGKRWVSPGHFLKLLLGSAFKTLCIPKEFYNTLKSLAKNIKAKFLGWSVGCKSVSTLENTIRGE